MIEKISLNKTVPYITQSKNNEMQNEPTFKNNTEITSKASGASMAYGTALLNKPVEQLSLAQNIKLLKNQGKIEGKDFDIDTFTSPAGHVVLTIRNKEQAPIKILHYKNGDLANVNGYETYQYYGDGLYKMYRFEGKNNSLYQVSENFGKECPPQEDFTQEGITFKTSPEEYIEFLKTNNVKYNVKKESYDGGHDIWIEEYDNLGRKVQETSWFFNDSPCVNRLTYDNDGKELKNIMFTPDGKTDVSTFIH